MATATAAKSLAQRANLMEGITNQIIEEHIVTQEAFANDSIKYKKNVDDVRETLKLDYQSGTYVSWAGLQPFTANEETDAILATYTTGQLADTITVDPAKLERIKNDKNKTFDIVEDALSEVRGRARVELEYQLNNGTGTARGSSVRGNDCIGFETLVPDSTTSLSANGIAVASHANYRPQVLNANGGPSGDWDSDRVFMLGAMQTRLSFKTKAAKLRPTVGLLSRDLANTMMEEMYQKFTPQKMDSSAKAQFGYDNQVFLGPMGMKYMFSDNVASNTVQFWNLQPEAFQIWTPYDKSVFKLEEHSGEGRYHGSPPIYEMRMCLCFLWRQPRAFGKLINANAGATLTLA